MWDRIWDLHVHKAASGGNSAASELLSAMLREQLVSNHVVMDSFAGIFAGISSEGERTGSAYIALCTTLFSFSKVPETLQGSKQPFFKDWINFVIRSLFSDDLWSGLRFSAVDVPFLSQPSLFAEMLLILLLKKTPSLSLPDDGNP